MLNQEKTMEQIVSLCKQRGFVYPGSEIYGGLANTWDYGPLGVELKNNVKKAWWKKFVQESPYNVGLDSAILMNPTTWVASGHVGGFSDPLIDCKECKGLAPDGIAVSSSGLYTLQYIISSTIEKLYTFMVSEEVLEELRKIMKQYVNTHIDKKFKSLEILEMCLK